MKFNTNIIVLLIVLATTIGVCNIERNAASQYAQNLTAMADTTNHYRHAYKINKDYIHELKRDNKELKKTLKDYKNVDNITTITTVTKLDTIYIPFSDTLDFIFNTSASVSHKFYSINASVSNEGLRINKISFPNETSIVVGDKKIKGFLGITKGTEYSIGVTHSNPYMKTVNLQHYTVTKKKRWYETTPFLIGTGLITGILIAK